MKKRVYNKLNTKVNNLENKIPEATTLIQISQHNADKQGLGKEMVDLIKKIPDVSGTVTTTVAQTNIGEVERKIPDFRGLMTNS